MTTITLAVVAVGVGIAYRMYATRSIPETAPEKVSALTVAARRDLYGDAFNEDVLMRPGQVLTAGLVEIDDDGIDDVSRVLGNLVGGASQRLGRLQTGFARSYALSMLGGAALVVAAILAVRVW
jgi:NADH-quinone oxidoreductase subunit L